MTASVIASAAALASTAWLCSALVAYLASRAQSDLAEMGARFVVREELMVHVVKASCSALRCAGQGEALWSTRTYVSQETEPGPGLVRRNRGALVSSYVVEIERAESLLRRERTAVTHAR